jgi:hypothetical protein
MRLVTAKPDHNPTLFIQCKGYHSGRPLKHYIPNSFSLYTDEEFAFEKALCIFYSRRYEQYLVGSVIPFLRLRDAHDLLCMGFAALKLHPPARLDALHKLDALILVYEENLAKIKLAQRQLSLSLINV